MSDSRESRRRLLVAGLLGVVVGVLLGGLLLDYSRGKLALRFPKLKLPPPPEELAKPHLDWAQRECERVIDEHVNAVNVFFAESKKNTRAFADAVLSLRSKWLLVTDYLTNKDRHQRFIREKFEEYIFEQSQLEEVVQQVVKSYLAHVRSIESKMLVNLRTDAADFPSAYGLGNIDENKLQGLYDEAIRRAMAATGSGLRADITTELVATIAGEVLTQVAVRLGVSAGILGTGAASGWTTFGIGLVVGLIVDQIVSRVWDWWADPRGNLAHDLENKLDELNRLIVDGSNDVKGLRSQLRDFARERAVLRRQVVLALLQSETGGTK